MDTIGNYNLRGRLKPLNCFLDSGWIVQEYSIYEPEDMFELTFEDLKSDLKLKNIIDGIYGLELEDENGTQYMRDWFEVLEER